MLKLEEHCIEEIKNSIFNLKTDDLYIEVLFSCTRIFILNTIYHIQIFKDTIYFLKDIKIHTRNNFYIGYCITEYVCNVKKILFEEFLAASEVPVEIKKIFIYGL